MNEWGVNCGSYLLGHRLCPPPGPMQQTCPRYPRRHYEKNDNIRHEDVGNTSKAFMERAQQRERTAEHNMAERRKHREGSTERERGAERREQGGSRVSCHAMYSHKVGGDRGVLPLGLLAQPPHLQLEGLISACVSHSVHSIYQDKT